MERAEDNQRRGGGRPLAAVLDGLRLMAAEVALDLSKAPATKAEICRRLDVDTSTLWRHSRNCDAVRDLVEQLVAAGHAVHQTPTERPSVQDPIRIAQPQEDIEAWRALPHAELARQGHQQLHRAANALQQFASRSARMKGASDLPRAVFELQRCLQTGSVALDKLRAYAEEWLRRQKADQDALRLPAQVNMMQAHDQQLISRAPEGRS